MVSTLPDLVFQHRTVYSNGDVQNRTEVISITHKNSERAVCHLFSQECHREDG